LVQKNDTKINNQSLRQFEQIMDEDFNTPSVLDFALQLLENPENKQTVGKIMEIWVLILTLNFRLIF